MTELVEGEEEDSDRGSACSARTSSRESLGAMDSIAEAERMAEAGTDALGMPLLAGNSEDSAALGGPTHPAAPLSKTRNLTLKHSVLRMHRHDFDNYALHSCQRQKI